MKLRKKIVVGGVIVLVVGALLFIYGFFCARAQMITLVSLILRGLLLGGLFALTGFGLSLAFGIMRVINVAHGDLAILAAFLSLACMNFLKIDPFVSFVIVAPTLFAIGFLSQKFLINRVLPRGLNHPVLVTFAIGIVIQNLLLLIFTPDAQSLTPVYLLGEGIKLGEIYLSRKYTVSFILALITFIAIHWFLKKTYLGKAMRAVPIDSEAAKMMGIRPEAIYNLAMGIAMLTTALAGILLGTTFPFYPYTGPGYLIIAFGVVIIGGLGSLKGTFIGGLIMGVSLILGGYFFGAHYQLMVCYLIIIAVLLLRPQGLFGGKA